MSNITLRWAIKPINLTQRYQIYGIRHAKLPVYITEMEVADTNRVDKVKPGNKVKTPKFVTIVNAHVTDV